MGGVYSRAVRGCVCMGGVYSRAVRGCVCMGGVYSRAVRGCVCMGGVYSRAVRGCVCMGGVYSRAVRGCVCVWEGYTVKHKLRDNLMIRQTLIKGRIFITEFYLFHVKEPVMNRSIIFNVLKWIYPIKTGFINV